MSKTFHAPNRGESAGDSKPLASELEAACDVRVRAWQYVFQCYAKKRADCASSGAIPPGSLAIRAYEKRKAAETANGSGGEEEAGQGHTEGHTPDNGRL